MRARDKLKRAVSNLKPTFSQEANKAINSQGLPPSNNLRLSKPNFYIRPITGDYRGTSQYKRDEVSFPNDGRSTEEVQLGKQSKTEV
jgi:hypothetical protein